MNSYGIAFAPKINFRSPDLVHDYYACNVDPDGVVGNDYYYDVYWDSCGRRSPESNFGSVDYTWYITSYGIANNGMFTITDSYGNNFFLYRDYKRYKFYPLSRRKFL